MESGKTSADRFDLNAELVAALKAIDNPVEEKN
jgi:hypothetical protein